LKQPHPNLGVGLEGCPYSKNTQQKNGSEHEISEPLFISSSLFDLLLAYSLTLLLIGGRFVIAAINLCSRYSICSGRHL